MTNLSPQAPKNDANDSAKSAVGDEPNRASIEALAQKLEALDKRRVNHDLSAPSNSRVGMKDASKGLKMATEFVCAVIVGALVGYGIDSIFGTLPWFTLLFFCFGTAAGFKNAYASAIGAEDDPLAGYKVFGLNRSKDKTGSRRETRVGDAESKQTVVDQTSTDGQGQ